MARIFFLKIILLLVVAVLMIGFFEYNLEKIPTSYSIKKLNIEKEAPEIQILILGSSDAIVGINPDFFSKKAFNMADSSQSLYYDLGIFSKYAAQLKNLQALIIPISYPSLQFNFDKSPESWRSFFYARVYGITQLQKSRQLFDIRKYSLFALYGQPRSILYALKGFRVDLAPNIMENGYQRDETSNAASINKTAGKSQIAIHASSMGAQYVQKNVQYVEQMIAIAKQMNAAPVIVTLPVSSSYSENTDKDVYEQMVSILSKISNEQNVKYLNYFNNESFYAEDFSDTFHLNSKGAEKFTKMLEQEIL